jgi:hypothetical protein
VCRLTKLCCFILGVFVTESENPSHHLERLQVLSKNVNDAINEIFSMAYAQTHELRFLPRSEVGTDIQLLEKSLWVNRTMIPLSSRMKTFQLIEAFFKTDSLAMSKAEILSAVYGSQQTRSERFTTAQDTNLTKLVSRTRSFLEESLNYIPQAQPIDWLVFDIKSRKYQLYKIRPLT